MAELRSSLRHNIALAENTQTQTLNEARILQQQNELQGCSLQKAFWEDFCKDDAECLKKAQKDSKVYGCNLKKGTGKIKIDEYEQYITGEFPQLTDTFNYVDSQLFFEENTYESLEQFQAELNYEIEKQYLEEVSQITDIRGCQALSLYTQYECFFNMQSMSAF